MRAMPTPSVNDKPGFHLDMPVSELIEHDTRAIEASVISLAPLVVKTMDGVIHETWPTPTFLFHCMIIHSSILIHSFIHPFIHTFIPYIQALHMQLLHHNA